MKNINFIIPLQVYPFDVMVSINQTNDEVEKSLEEVGFDYADANVRCDSDTRKGKTIMFKTNQTIIRMFSFDEDPVHYGFLAHEIFHAVEFVMERIGMKLCIKSDEAYAYLVQYLTTQIYTKLAEITKPGDKSGLVLH